MKHSDGCKCVSCLRVDVECCGKRFNTWPGLARHRNSRLHYENNPSQPGAHKFGKRTKRRTQVVVVPDGLGYLTTTLTTPERLSSVSLGAVQRFAAILNNQRHFRSCKFSRKERNTLRELNAGPLPYDLNATVTLPDEQAKVIYQLAATVNVPVKSICSLLLSYGIEYLAKELRATRNAPTPRDPVPLVRNKDSVKNDDLPGTSKTQAQSGARADAVSSIRAPASTQGIQRPTQNPPGSVRGSDLQSGRFTPKRVSPSKTT